MFNIHVFTLILHIRIFSIGCELVNKA